MASEVPIASQVSIASMVSIAPKVATLKAAASAQPRNPALTSSTRFTTPSQGTSKSSRLKERRQGPGWTRLGQTGREPRGRHQLLPQQPQLQINRGCQRFSPTILVSIHSQIRHHRSLFIYVFFFILFGLPHSGLSLFDYLFIIFTLKLRLHPRTNIEQIKCIQYTVSHIIARWAITHI